MPFFKLFSIFSFKFPFYATIDQIMTARHNTILFDVTDECNCTEERLIRAEFIGIPLRRAIIDITFGEDGLRNILQNKAIIELEERLLIPKHLRRKEGE